LSEGFRRFTAPPPPCQSGRGHPATHKILAAAYRVVSIVPHDAAQIEPDIIEQVLDGSWSDDERKLLHITLPEVTDSTMRDDRSINRDLSLLQAMSEHLAKSHWRLKYGKDIEMNFSSYTIPIKENPANPKRMPWTPKHLEVMYGLPVPIGAVLWRVACASSSSSALRNSFSPSASVRVPRVILSISMPSISSHMAASRRTRRRASTGSAVPNEMLIGRLHL